jgi:hypothetical protein
MLSLREQIREFKYRLLKSVGGRDVQLFMPELLLTVEVFDKDGNRTYKLHRHSHSWVRNAYNYLFAQMCAKNLEDSTYGAGLQSLTDTSGTVIYNAGLLHSLNRSNHDIRMDGGMLAVAGDDTHGIIIGTGAVAENFEDYELGSQIVNGNGTGEMDHAQSNLHSISYASLVLKDTLVRDFNNNSGASIGVNEVGIVCGGIYMTGTVTSAYDILFARDKLGAQVDVADTAQLRVTYEISLTYPS